MAAGTIRDRSLLCKLPVVVVFMAVKAFFMPDRICNIVPVAGFAGNRLVHIFKREPGFGVIKVVYSPDRMKGCFRMAGSAIRPELPVMGIRMAARTLLVLYSCKLLEFHITFHRHRVTFLTGYRLMHTPQFEPGCSMAEFDGRFECVKAMAILARGGQVFLMVIGMAAHAGRAQSKVCEFLVPDC